MDMSAKPVLPDVAARAIGPEAAVEARWERLVLNWEGRARENKRGPGSYNDGLVRLLRAARAEPRLRRLFPFTSHYNLHFSLSTTQPWAEQGLPNAHPQEGGSYLVGRWHESGERVTAATPEEAVALLVERLPADLGPVFNRPDAAEEHHASEAGAALIVLSPRVPDGGSLLAPEVREASPAPADEPAARHGASVGRIDERTFTEQVRVAEKRAEERTEEQTDQGS